MNGKILKMIKNPMRKEKINPVPIYFKNRTELKCSFKIIIMLRKNYSQALGS